MPTSDLATSTTTVAYAFISPTDPRNSSDLELLRHWCKGSNHNMEILTEEIHPRERGSKVWSEVLCQIESGQIKTLVVPRLSHIIGNDFIGLSKFLSYLRSKGAKLRSIQEFIDSDRESHQDIVTNFYLEVTGKKVIGGGQ